MINMARWLVEIPWTTRLAGSRENSVLEPLGCSSSPGCLIPSWKTSGYFAAVIPSGRRPAVFDEALSARIWEVISSVYPNHRKNSGGFGISEYNSKESISKLFSETAGLSEVEFLDFDVGFSTSKDEFISELGSLYLFDIMPEEIKTRALSDIRQFLEKNYQEPAVVPFHRAFVLISSRKT